MNIELAKLLGVAMPDIELVIFDKGSNDQDEDENWPL
jgi:hypothetical protein